MSVARKQQPMYRNVVDMAIVLHGDDSITVFARRLSEYTGYPITKNTVANWRRRGQFSRDVIAAVHKMTRIPLTTLLDGL